VRKRKKEIEQGWNMRISFKYVASILKWAKIAVVNLAVLLFLLIVVEILARSVWTARSCIQSECDFSRVTGLKVQNIDRAADIGITRFDELLGYVPREGFSAIMNAPPWHGGKLTIRKDGFRSNGSEPPPLPADVLVVGGSFPFGEQVSDNETWPACLERKLGRGVDNGGVFGYGAAQALKRASLKLAEKNYTDLILSIYFGAAFQWDRLSYRVGLPKPAVIHTQSGIALSAVPDPNAPGTKFNPLHHEALSFVYERSEMLGAMLDRFFPEYNTVGDRLTVVHPNAANENEIVDWDLRQLSSLPIKNKLLLLQYGSLDTTSIAEERELVLRTASELSIKVIDPITVMRNYKESDLWYKYGNHHTPLGNEVVCSYLFEHGFSKRTMTFRSHSPSTAQVNASALDR
jgi:hypothetical protein